MVFYTYPKLSRQFGVSIYHSSDENLTVSQDFIRIQKAVVSLILKDFVHDEIIDYGGGEEIRTLDTR
ncbi:hypothetical protein [Caedibacter taeniospiralis]|uniref:hypothetical protein n=1 Tax=Caedibacter taeniospiralis TaxID=28907 RepID=UPI0037C02798